MKKILCLCVAFALTVILSCGCAEKTTKSRKKDTVSVEEETYYDMGSDLPEDKSTDIAYISDRECSFYKENNEYIVFFGLQDENQNYVSASGKATIVVLDNNNIKLYSETINFSEADFSNWSNNSRDNSRYLCGLHIPKSKIKGSTSSSGKLNLTVVTDTASFPEGSMMIYDLPSKAVSIQLPRTPQTVKNYDYDGAVKFEAVVEKITCSTETNYDGKSTATFVITAKLTANYSKYSSSYFYIGYKLKNSKGIVIKSEKAMLPSVGIGELVQDDIIIFDLDPMDSYVLEFSDTNY